MKAVISFVNNKSFEVGRLRAKFIYNGRTQCLWMVGIKEVEVIAKAGYLRLLGGGLIGDDRAIEENSECGDQ